MGNLAIDGVDGELVVLGKFPRPFSRGVQAIVCRSNDRWGTEGDANGFATDGMLNGFGIIPEFIDVPDTIDGMNEKSDVFGGGNDVATSCFFIDVKDLNTLYEGGEWKKKGEVNSDLKNICWQMVCCSKVNEFKADTLSF